MGGGGVGRGVWGEGGVGTLVGETCGILIPVQSGKLTFPGVYQTNYGVKIHARN